MDPIVPGVWRFSARTPTLLPATHTNSYAIDVGEGLVLVEPASPYPDEQAQFLSWAHKLAQQRPLVALLATHHHPDHVGGAEHFCRALELPLWTHEATARALPELTIHRHLHEGERLGEWQLLHTPGHAPGHLCLHHAATEVLIVGDMLASVGTILVPPDDGDMGEYLRQLERLSRLAPRWALPAHGEPIDAPVALFQHYIAHRLAREAKVVAALPGTLDELLPRAYDDAPSHALPFARLSLRAHLDKLVREGRAQLEGERYLLK